MLRFFSIIFLVGFLILASCASIPKNNYTGRFSHALNWGLNPVTQTAWSRSEIRTAMQSKDSSLGIELNDLLKAAQKDLEDRVQPQAIDRIEKEGVLNSDPRHSASDEALKGTESILKWAICSEIANQPLNQECFEAAYKGTMKWLRTFHPTGNPINDNQMLRMFVTIDFLFDDLKKEDQTLVKNWLKEFIVSGDKYFLSLKKKNSPDNWMTWRLSIRSLSSVIIQEQDEILKTKNLLEQHALLNLVEPNHWNSDNSCKNEDNTSYGSFDFRHRDALHYHVYNLEAWIWTSILTPNLITSKSSTSIENALQFIQPYYQKKKIHVEFLCSKVKFDSRRKDAGQKEFQNQNWDPKNARKLLRMARIRYPAIRSWSEDVVDNNYPPWIKLLAAVNVDNNP